MFSDFSRRSTQKELIDLGPEYYTPEEYDDCLKKLFKINIYMGFFRELIKVIKKSPIKSFKKSVLDIGCGSGLFLLKLAKKFPHMNLTGIDISQAAIQQAQQNLELFQKKYNLNSQIIFKEQINPEINGALKSHDIILANLVCHHIEDKALIRFIQTAHNTAAEMVIINDLHRHKIAYLFYSLISPWLFKNRLITLDGQVSIKRGFKRREWENLLYKAGIKNYKINWRFPFWWQVIIYKEAK